MRSVLLINITKTEGLIINLIKLMIQIFNSINLSVPYVGVAKNVKALLAHPVSDSKNHSHDTGHSVATL